METIDNNQRYSLEEAQAEADKLKYLIADGKYECYEDAHFHLPDEELEYEVTYGYIDRLAKESLGMYVAPIDGGCPDTEETEPYSDELNEEI